MAPPTIANLHAFARLYGVVRWFHPSDAASQVDWDRFAIDGARRVVDAPDAAVLRMRLAELFQPIAPTVQIARVDEAFSEVAALHPRQTEDLQLIAWQHKGFGDSSIATGYASKRLHRDRTVAVPGALFASLWQAIDAIPLRGAHVRLRGRLRAGSNGRGQLWVRVDRGATAGFFDNMGRQPIVGDMWGVGEIVGVVDADATRIVFGVLNESSGPVWYDDLELAVQTTGGDWRPLEVPDAGFEAPDALASWHTGIGRDVPQTTIKGWRIERDPQSPARGTASLRLEPITTVIAEDLFDLEPAPGETFDVDLGSGLRARAPIALYASGSKTIGDDPAAARPLLVTRGSVALGFDRVTGAADVIVFWNVLRHFWPYSDTINVDWSAMLDAALADADDDRSMDDHVATLQRLSVRTPDGHIDVDCPGETPPGYPPFAVTLAEAQVVVTSSADPSVQRGDVLVTVDGVPAADQLALDASYVSGSAQWQRARALRRFDRGPVGSTLVVHLRRGDRPLDVKVTRVGTGEAEPPSHGPLDRLDDGSYYVDLSRATMAEIEAAVAALATAPGVVFDLRGYPNANHDALSYLMTRPNDLKGWEEIPLIIRPDSASTPAGWEDTSTWNMPKVSVRQPHLRGRIAFVTGAGAISYAESVMAMVAYYHLGEIVGEPTAGTNGDIARIGFPTGCSTWFTGRRVTRPGGGQHHLIGVQPTIPATRSVVGIRAGRDEVLEKALAYVRGGAR